MPVKRSPIVAAAVIALAVAAWIALSWAEPAQPVADPAAPNIVVIMTDDQNAGTVNRRTMPRTARLLKRGGTDFTEAVVTTPQCCPSRATFLTGQYGHNNGVLSNSDAYPELRDSANVLPSWLREAGYTTAHVGRFLKDYGRGEEVERTSDPAPGWDGWAVMTGVRYFDYTIAYDGETAHYGHRPSNYSTTVFTRGAVDYVRANVADEGPMFLSVAYVAPHKERDFNRDSYCDGSVIPAPRDSHRFTGEPLPDKRSIGERDIADKPGFIRSATQLEDKRAKTVRAYRCGLAALREVDRGVKRIYDAFREAGELDNTVFIFTSDNGTFHGEHRLPGGKSFPYEESIRVPLLIRMPERMLGGGREHGSVSELVANVDLAPTILDLARAEPCVEGDCRLLDGRSLLPLMTGRGPSWPEERAILIELHETTEAGEQRLPCSYFGVRTRRDFYVHYTEVRDRLTGGCAPADVVEYYDLVEDPEQLQNLAESGRLSRRRAELAGLLDALRTCQGLPGRDVPAGAQPCG